MSNYQCHNCPRRTAMNEIGARAAGWIVWTGKTIGGKETTRIYCPACAGREEAPAPSWDAECGTCDARMGDDAWDDDEPFTKEDAENWKDEHRCDPDVRLISPAEIEQERLRVAKYAAAVSS